MQNLTRRGFTRLVRKHQRFAALILLRSSVGITYSNVDFYPDLDAIRS